MTHLDLRGISNDTLKSLHPQTEEYRRIVKASAAIGSGISMVGASRSGGDKSQQDDPKENQDGETQAETLHRVILYTLLNSRIERDVLLFDCWAGWALKGHKIHTGTSELVCDGKLIKMQTLYNESWNQYRKRFGIGVSNVDSFYSMVLGHLRDYKYNPWGDAMDRLPAMNPEEFKAKHGFDPHYMAMELVGDDSELIQKLWMYQFTGAIKRTIEPGCKHQQMLILISPEKGLGKTTFLQAIARTPGESQHSTDNYLQMRSLKNNKADLEKLRGKVIVNLDECDSAFQGLAADDLKEVVTAQTDNYRAPYERNAADHPRSSVLFATTNKVELIQDMDGDRRFIPVRVNKPINTQWVTDNWGDFWGFYKYCYLMSLESESVYRNWLSKVEEALLVKLQVQYKANPPWMVILCEVLDILEDSNNNKLCLSASDLVLVFGGAGSGTKSYMSAAIKGKLKERGYLEGKPKCSDGKQPGSPRLFLGKNPKNISPDEIDNACRKYKSGEYQPKARKVVDEPMTTIKAGCEFPVYQQLDIWGALEQAQKTEQHSLKIAAISAKLAAEYPTETEEEKLAKYF